MTAVLFVELDADQFVNVWLVSPVTGAADGWTVVALGASSVRVRRPVADVVALLEGGAS